MYFVIQINETQHIICIFLTRICDKNIQSYVRKSCLFTTIYYNKILIYLMYPLKHYIVQYHQNITVMAFYCLIVRQAFENNNNDQNNT